MKEERLQEIKDSVEFQYTLAKAKGFDNALLFTNEEEELIEEIERLNNIINLMSDFLVKHIANGGLDFMYRQGFKDCYDKLQELKGEDKE